MAQRKTDRRNRQGEQTRTRLLEETMRLAAGHGYEGTKLSMVRRATGLSASSIYWHFSDKDQLIAAALEHAFRVQSASTPNWLDSPARQPRREDLYDKLLAFPSTDSEMDYWRFGLQLVVVRPPEESPARARFLDIRRQSVDWLGRWWERGFDEDMDQSRDAALLMGHFTVALRDGAIIRDGALIRRHGQRPLDRRRVMWLLACCLDAAEIRLAELARTERLDRLPPAAPAQVDAGEGQGPREVFLRAAEEAVAEYGYGGVTVARVCEKAGLPPSSLYWSFKDKDELISTVVAGACRRWDAARPPLAPRPEDGNWSRVLAVQLLRTMDNLAAESGVMRLGLLLLLQRAAVAEADRRNLEAVLQDMQAMTAQWFRTVLSPALADDERAELADYLAECLFILLEGLLLSRQIGERQWAPELLADLMGAALHGAALQAEQDCAVPAGSGAAAGTAVPDGGAA